jgi:hypothetical protein
MKEERFTMLGRVAGQIQALLPEGFRIGRVGAVSAGWDDAAEICCGETRGQVSPGRQPGALFLHGPLRSRPASARRLRRDAEGNL